MTVDVIRRSGASGSVTVPTPPLGLPDCHWCVEDLADGVEAYDADPATIRYDGKLSCAWHALFFYGSAPASAFLALGRDV